MAARVAPSSSYPQAMAPQQAIPPQQTMPPQQQQMPPQQSPLATIKTKSGVTMQVYFELDVAQQPDRARMCGFGDKDRRPITPPPCVRLIIRDATTGGEIDYSDVDAGAFVLSVDIWNADATQPQNEVRHSNTSPSVSISMASLTSYPPPPDHSGVNPYMQQQYQYGRGMGYGGYGGGYPGYASGGNFQRNLIGSLSVSASYLTDTEDKSGYWFVLQDLSVRTEGNFRLRLAFMNLSVPLSAPNNSSQQIPYINGSNQPSRVPVLATRFTETFQVYSAKKFPGVKESTELSKKFANQGIKIPIRKDGGGPGSRKRGSDEGSDEN